MNMNYGGEAPYMVQGNPLKDFRVSWVLVCVSVRACVCVCVFTLAPIVLQPVRAVLR